MAELKVGTVASWHQLSPILAVFRLMPEDATPFPNYRPGQYIALRREDCNLTRRIAGQDGRFHVVAVLDEQGRPKRGPVTHSYSISSAPYETRDDGHLEFYLVLENDGEGHPGRLTESLFRIRPQGDNRVSYVNRIVGNFTLEDRAKAFRNVVWIGTGTGLAPFASMIKQLQRDALDGRRTNVRYTLIHTNRTFEELGYHEQLLAIEAAGAFDFVYVPTVSRPTPRDFAEPRIGRGRANNVLRHIFGMPLKEEAAVADRAAFEKAVKPALPRHLTSQQLRGRLEPTAETVILTCGNPSLMADIEHVAGANRIRFEKEDW